jgi:transcriptional regulator with XRE-family HTH domain
MKTLDHIIAKLPAARRAKIAARTEQLIVEEVALQHLRKARRLTQKRMAQLLDIGQDSVSRIETRSDLLLSTLRNYVEAMGGSLKLVVEFPDSTAVLSSLGEAKTAKSAQLANKKTARGSRRLPIVHVNN